MNRAELLAEASKAVGNRGPYGTPEDNFLRIARRWNAHLANIDHRELTPADVAIMCADIKLSRLEATPSHIDSWVDLAGYAACGAEVATRHRPPPPEPAEAPDASFYDWDGYHYASEGP